MNDETTKAYNLGKEYAESHPYQEYPLSGEWADDILPNDIVRAVGVDPDTCDDFYYDTLVAYWCAGYYDYWDL